MPRITINLSPKQKVFIDSQKRYRALCGGIGSGKSRAGAYDIIRRSKAGRLYLVLAPTYTLLSDATFRMVKERAEEIGALAKIKTYPPQAMTLTNGAEIIFRSADDPERLRGPNLSGIWMDEASLMKRDVFNIAIGRLREGGEDGFLTATFTPKGKSHWTHEVFATGNPDVFIVFVRTRDNPFLPPTFEAAVRRQYTSALAAQELDAEFVDAAGLLFQRHWFKIVDMPPALVAKARAWDLAATVPDGKNDPDYTAGVLMGRTEANDFYILDVRRVRVSPQQVCELLRATAQADGLETAIYLEQEPGASGKIVVDSFARLLAGFNFRGEPSTGDKILRAQPLAAAAESGIIHVVRGPWNKDYLDEIETFPTGSHDDMTDSSSRCFAQLASDLAWSSPPSSGERKDSVAGSAPYGMFTGDKSVAEMIEEMGM